MPSSIITGIFSILGVIVGICGTFFAQLFLRKEKFKEIIYKEKLSAYREIIEKLFDVVIGAHRYKAEKTIQDDKEWTNKVSSFCITIARNEFVVSKDVYNLFSEFAKMLVKLKTIDDVTYTKMVRYSTDIINTIRKDIGVDILSKDLEKTFQFWVENAHEG